MDEENVTLDRLFAAIERGISQGLDGLQTVAAWPDISERVSLPALFLEVSEFEPGVDSGTGESALVVKFEARIIVGAELPRHNQQAMQLATQLAVLLRYQYWGLEGIGPAEFVQAVPDWTKPELDGYTVWLVEWTQEVTQGKQAWPWPDNPPAHLELQVDPEALEASMALL